MRLIVVGKVKENIQKEVDFYLKQLPQLQLIEIKDSTPQKEGELIVKQLKDSYPIAFSIKGKKYDSIAFSNHLKSLENKKNVTFIIGGSTGLSKAVYDLCFEEISFSDLTFPHGLMRLMVVEQIYRAVKIQENHPYHK